ncbi:Endothelin-converting enzyme 2 [Biomphalaria glabrata]|nr:FMRFamide receptor-like [Biomphalaria glabrata]
MTVNISANWPLSSTINQLSSPKLSDVSDNIRELFEVVNMSVLTCVISMLGIVSNIINIVVFYKQGMKSTVNISFMALSITDLINVLLMVWVSISSFPALNSSFDIVINPKEVNYLTGGFSHGCLARIIAWITVYMTAERCLCIAMPLKVKRFLTPRRTLLVMITIYLHIVGPMTLEYMYFNLGWKFSPQFNKSVVGLVVSVDNNQLDEVSFILMSVLMMSPFTLVIFLTITLIVQLRKMSRWRTLSISKENQFNRLSLKDRMAIRTVLVIASVLILTFTPGLILCAMCFMVPGFGINGRLRNLFIVVSSIVYVFEATNASINMVLYYKMHSSYRQTLQTYLSCSSRSQVS